MTASLDDGLLATPAAAERHGDAPHAAPEPPHVAQARQLVRDAADAAELAAARWAVARDAAADAEATVRVAESKSEDYEQDPKRADWQRLAAREAVSKATRDHARAVSDEDTARANHQSAQEDVAVATRALHAAQQTTEAESEADRNHFPTVYAFVAEYVVVIYAYEITKQDTRVRWCDLWWEHPEALARLEACWKAFEVLRRDPGTGMSVWFRDHADPCMDRLLADSGPFSRCLPDHQHNIRPRLTMATPPAWLTEHSGSTAS